MPCDVFLYDTTFSPLFYSGVLAYASDDAGRNLAGPVSNTRIGQKSGFHLGFKQQRCIYHVDAHDPSGTYAPANLFHLNANEPGTLEIVLYRNPPPRSQSGRTPTTAKAIDSYIESQPNWSDENKRAVRILVEAVRVKTGTMNRVLQGFMREWHDWLYTLGINPTII